MIIYFVEAEKRFEKTFEKFFKKIRRIKKKQYLCNPNQNNNGWDTNKSSLKRLKKQVQASTEKFNFREASIQLSKDNGICQDRLRDIKNIL